MSSVSPQISGERSSPFETYLSIQFISILRHAHSAQTLTTESRQCMRMVTAHAHRVGEEWVNGPSEDGHQNHIPQQVPLSLYYRKSLLMPAILWFKTKERKPQPLINSPQVVEHEIFLKKSNKSARVWATPTLLTYVIDRRMHKECTHKKRSSKRQILWNKKQEITDNTFLC